MTALPPDFDPDFEPQHHQLVVFANEDQEPSLRDAAEHVMWLAVANFIGVVVAAALVSYTWGYIRYFLHLPGIDFHKAFALLVILRVLGLVVRL